MKTNQNIQGGMLKDPYYPVYAQYFVLYLKGMEKEGIHLDAITVQNEPFNDGNTPSMQFLAKKEEAFIRDYLGPAFHRSGIHTKIILYDHNCDAPEYPISILTDPKAAQYADGSGFHLYVGQTSAMSKVHEAFPKKNLYFTEMMVVNHRTFDMAGPMNRIFIGAMRNWSRNIILWNLAADPQNRPHTDNGGCAGCQGAITIDKDSVSTNLAYYTLTQVSRFVPPGSVRIGSNLSEGLPNMAFIRTDDTLVLVAVNQHSDERTVQINWPSGQTKVLLPSHSVATFTFPK
jgi:glucosylceramidase